MTDKLQRPESFEFALDFLGDPEASELRAYIEQLEARAALAEPVGEGVTDEELLDIAAQSIEPYEKIRPGEYEAENNCAIEVYSSELVSFARAVLSRFGHQPAPPAAGEVGELVEFLRDWGDDYADEGTKWHRAANLLSQRHPAPVPVAIPGEEYHEDMGAVTWWRFPVDEPPWVGTPNDSDWPGYHTHFTPAPTEPFTALPLPAGEME